MAPAWWRALLVWALIVPIAILNGVLREKFFSPLLDPGIALPLSGVLLAALILALAWIMLPWLGPLDTHGHLAVGIGWFALTVVFEFSFGHFIAGKSWSELLQAYDMTSGNLWPAVLVVTAAAPWLAAKLRVVA